MTRENGMSIEAVLRVNGVLAHGFGILPKLVMLDQDLSIEAKAIYAYFCSLSGNGETAFPSREHLLQTLQVSKDTYYKHFQKLQEAGYITVMQQKAEENRFARNIYTIEQNPKGMKTDLQECRTKEGDMRIYARGVKSMGFGVIPRTVMQDQRLSIKAKGLYGYLSVFGGAGGGVFLKRDLILKDLEVSIGSYRKYMDELRRIGYITTCMYKEEGKFKGMDIILEEYPNPVEKSLKEEKTPQHKISDTGENGLNKGFSDVINRDINFRTRENEHRDTDFRTRENQDTYYNYLYNYNNNNITHSKDYIYISQTEGVRELFCGYKLNDKPFSQEEAERLTDFLIDPEARKLANYGDVIRVSAVNLLSAALSELLTERGLIELRGSHITGRHVLKAFNNLFEEYSCIREISMTASWEEISKALRESCNPLFDEIEDRYVDAEKEGTIKTNNRIKYMKAIIWSVLSTGALCHVTRK